MVILLVVYNGLTPQSCSSVWKTEVTGYLSRLQAGPRVRLQHESCHVFMAECQMMYNTVHRKTSISNDYLAQLLVSCLDFRTHLERKITFKPFQISDRYFLCLILFGIEIRSWKNKPDAPIDVASDEAHVVELEGECEWQYSVKRPMRLTMWT